MVTKTFTVESTEQRAAEVESAVSHGEGTIDRPNRRLYRCSNRVLLQDDPRAASEVGKEVGCGRTADSGAAERSNGVRMVDYRIRPPESEPLSVRLIDDTSEERPSLAP